MMSKKMVKIISIIMAALMLLSVCAVLVNVLAADESMYETYVIPETGDNDSDYLVPAGVAVAALLAIIICVVLPKLKSKSSREDDSPPSEDEDEASGEKPRIIKGDKDSRD